MKSKYVSAVVRDAYSTLYFVRMYVVRMLCTGRCDRYLYIHPETDNKERGTAINRDGRGADEVGGKKVFILGWCVCTVQQRTRKVAAQQ